MVSTNQIQKNLQKRSGIWPNNLLKHRSGQKTASTGRANARRLARR